MRDKIIGTICLVLGIIVFVTTGTSFAYFSSTTNGNGGDIGGTIMNFDVDFKLTKKTSTNQLVPLDDNNVIIAANNNCVDSYGYDVCALYEITLTNNGDPQILNAHITPTEGTNYITENLKGQLLNSDLSSSVSDILTLTNNNEIILDEKRYFNVNKNDLYQVSLTTKSTLYLVIWLTDTHEYQNDDYNKDYFGKIAFESISGDKITATFNS